MRTVHQKSTKNRTATKKTTPPTREATAADERRARIMRSDFHRLDRGSPGQTPNERTAIDRVLEDDVRAAATAALENVEILRAAFDSFALDRVGLELDESEYGLASTRGAAAIADLKNILRLVATVRP